MLRCVVVVLWVYLLWLFRRSTHLVLRAQNVQVMLLPSSSVSHSAAMVLLLTDERQRRKRSHSTLLAGAKKGVRASSSKMFEHFFVVGADPKEGGDVRSDPKLLFQYPSDP